MRSVFLVLCSLLFSLAHAQKEKMYKYNILLSSADAAPEFTAGKGTMVYSGDDAQERIFFSQYQISEFYQTYPASRRAKTLSYFMFVTPNKSLADDLVKKFPQKYLSVENMTDVKYMLSDYYPNDYGNSGPNGYTPGTADLNLGCFDYVHAPKAWDYTLGNVKIGIADLKVAITDAEFSDKTTIYHSTNFGTGGHGTGVAAIAAAKGNNTYGITGICPDCPILNTPHGNYNYLLELAYNGAKVINMSWWNYFDPEGDYNSGVVFTDYGSFPSQQAVINEIYNNGVILVAAAGNFNSFEYPNNLGYHYPASYENVISVTCVNYLNTFGSVTLSDSTYGNVSLYATDMVSPAAISNYMGHTPIDFMDYIPTSAGALNAYWPRATNEKVDICAPGYQVPRYNEYLIGGPVLYGDATSLATPFVTGTFGLMFSVDPCLRNFEAEDILQLTSKRIEHLPGNEAFVGRSGSGKLETGDAVEFVSEMIDPSGNAVIDGQDFYRFDFNLERINNKLTISNQTFRDGSKADFTAKNIIDVMTSDFKPDSSGLIDLKVNAAIDVDDCMESDRMPYYKEKTKNASNKNDSKLYPNPNKGEFTIAADDRHQGGITVTIMDLLGKPVYETSAEDQRFDLRVNQLPAGMYIARLTSSGHTESIKFVKQ